MLCIICSIIMNAYSKWKKEVCIRVMYSQANSKKDRLTITVFGDRGMRQKAKHSQSLQRDITLKFV